MTDYATRDAPVAAVRKEPKDKAAVGALADWLDENGRGDYAAKLRAAAHEWEDVSYHGSPRYKCRCCQAFKYGNRTVRCRAAITWWLTKMTQEEADERAELKAILAAEARTAYLRSRYGDSP